MVGAREIPGQNGLASSVGDIAEMHGRGDNVVPETLDNHLGCGIAPVAWSETLHDQAGEEVDDLDGDTANDFNIARLVSVQQEIDNHFGGSKYR